MQSPDATGNRRSACDRCRSQKLRCKRGLGGSAAQCDRCIKANAECITGPALKSGRPQHLCQELRIEDHQAITRTQMDSVAALPTFPTPPDTTLDFGTALNHGDSDMQLLAIPHHFDEFDNMWTNTFDQQLTGSMPDLLSATSRDNIQNGIATPLTPPSNARNTPLTMLGELQKEVLDDLQAIKACTTVDKCSAATLPDGQTHNFLIGRMLDHATALLEILEFTGTHGHFPLMLSIVSSYVCIVRIFRTILSSVQDSMPFLMDLQPVPQLFPGMNLGGFRLEGRVDLQVQILAQVSEDIINKIETVFANSRMAEVVSKMLTEEASEQPPLDDPRGHCAPLRDILESLKRVCETSRAING